MATAGIARISGQSPALRGGDSGRMAGRRLRRLPPEIRTLPFSSSCACWNAIETHVVLRSHTIATTLLVILLAAGCEKHQRATTAPSNKGLTKETTEAGKHSTGEQAAAVPAAEQGIEIATPTWIRARPRDACGLAQCVLTLHPGWRGWRDGLGWWHGMAAVFRWRVCVLFAGRAVGDAARQARADWVCAAAGRAGAGARGIAPCG